MIFRKKKAKVQPKNDVAEARAMRRDAHIEYGELKQQEPLVKSLTQALMDRREYNHFGDSISITFVRR